MSSKKPFLNMDERNKMIALRVIAIMYFLTIISMQAVIIFRQFALGQSIYDFEDFAIIFTVNALFLIAALLYFGALPFHKIKIKAILLAYVGIVIAGSLFTYTKYNIFQNADLTTVELLNKLFINIIVSGLILIFYLVFWFLGKRRVEKDIEE